MSEYQYYEFAVVNLPLAVAREKRLAGLAVEADRVWDRASARIAEKSRRGYDIAVDLLVNLQEGCAPGVFAAELEGLRRAHARMVSVVERLTGL